MSTRLCASNPWSVACYALQATQIKSRPNERRRMEKKVQKNNKHQAKMFVCRSIK